MSKLQVFRRVVMEADIRNDTVYKDFLSRNLQIWVTCKMGVGRWKENFCCTVSRERVDQRFFFFLNRKLVNKEACQYISQKYVLCNQGPGRVGLWLVD